MLFPLYDLNPHHRVPWLTVLLILLNVGVMFSMGVAPDPNTVFQHGFVPKRLTELGSGQPVVAPVAAAEERGRVVQVAAVPLSTEPGDVYPTFITAMFLHAHWLHLLANMWWLWIFGNNVEDRLGHFLYLCYYLLGGLIATLCHWALHQDSTVPMIGASGAVAAVLGGYAITYPWAKVRTLIFFGLVLIVDLPALVLLGFFFLLDIAQGILALDGAQQAVAFWAHVGGFISGLLLMPFMSLGAPPPESDWEKEADDMFRFDERRS